MIEIRMLNKSDMPEAIKLKISCWTEELAGKAENTLSYQEELETFIEWMESGEENNDVRLLIGAFENDVLLGTAFASFAEPEDIPAKGIELNGFWVSKEHRNKGIGLQLLANVLDFYLELGMEKVVIYNHHYAPSNNFYYKFGANVLKQTYQMSGKLLIDIFVADIHDLKNNIVKKIKKNEIV